MDSGGCVLFKIIRIKKIDPAPSRFKYLLYRAMHKKSKKIFYILFLILFLMSGFLITNFKYNNISFISFFEEKALSLGKFIKQRHSFQVNRIKIISKNEELILTIKSILNYELPMSSLDIDVSKVQRLIEGINAVKFANVRITPNKVLEIYVKERRPVVVHKKNEVYFLLDKDGVIVDQIFSRKDRYDLPLISGNGVKNKINEALTILIASGPLIPRVRGLVRIGERRWNIILDNNQFILLPEKDPIKALKKVESLEINHDIFKKDILGIDLRNEDRPILRLNEENFRNKNFFSGDNV